MAGWSCVVSKLHRRRSGEVERRQRHAPGGSGNDNTNQQVEDDKLMVEEMRVLMMVMMHLRAVCFVRAIFDDEDG